MKTTANRPTKFLSWFVAVLLLLLSSPVSADSWTLPGVETYTSADGRTRLTITPRALKSQLAYFEDAVAKRRTPGQRKGGPARPTALLEHLDATGKWHLGWQGPLINDVAPVRAIVANSGRFATFDNWHMVGWGDDAVVIYAPNGQIVRAFALKDLVRSDHLASFSRSVSSIGWGDAHHISPSDDRLILEIAVPGRDRTVPLEIDLVTATPLQSPDAIWMAAQAIRAETAGKSAATVSRRDADPKTEAELNKLADELEQAADSLEGEVIKPKDRHPR